MELKVVCNCGQKYKFEVEPVHGRMPFPINCPACGADGTQFANAQLAQMPASVGSAPAPISMAAPAPVAAMAAPAPMPVGAMSAPPSPAALAGLRLNRSESPPPPVAPPISAPVAAAAAPAPRAGALPKYMQANSATQNNNFKLGIVGALLGAVVAVGLMGAFITFTGFRFPYMGTIEGAIIGFGARSMYRGTSSTLGGMAAVVACLSIALTYLAFFHGAAILLRGLISMVIGVIIAFKVAS